MTKSTKHLKLEKNLGQTHPPVCTQKISKTQHTYTSPLPIHSIKVTNKPEHNSITGTISQRTSINHQRIMQPKERKKKNKKLHRHAQRKCPDSLPETAKK